MVVLCSLNDISDHLCGRQPEVTDCGAESSAHVAIVECVTLHTTGMHSNVCELIP